MIELKLNLPNWFLIGCLAYLVVRVIFNVAIVVTGRRRQQKMGDKLASSGMLKGRK